MSKVEIYITILLFIAVALSIYNKIEGKKLSLSKKLETAKKHAQYKYLANTDLNAVSFKYDDGTVVSISKLLKKIHKKHCVIERSNSSLIIKNDVDNLLNVELVKILNQFYEVNNAGIADICPTNSDISYSKIFSTKLNSISDHLNQIIEKQVATDTLIDFDIKQYVEQSTLMQAESLIEPLRKKGNNILEKIRKDNNMEAVIVIDKLINQYLIQVAVDYKLSLNQEKFNQNRKAEEVLKSILDKVEQYLDEIEKNHTTDIFAVDNAPKRDYYNELLVFERYINQRIPFGFI